MSNHVYRFLNIFLSSDLEIINLFSLGIAKFVLLFLTFFLINLEVHNSIRDSKPLSFLDRLELFIEREEDNFEVSSLLEHV